MTDLNERDIPQGERDKAGGGDFAGKNRSFPILKPEDVAAAAASLGRAGSDNFSTDQIKANIIRIAKKKGAAYVAKLPEAWKESAVDDGLDELEPLVERAVARDGTIDLKIIQPGWGATGYYPKEVLERDGPKVWPANTQMFLDHPTESEMRERPERSVADLAAITISDARFHENGKAGAGLYAKAIVMPQYRDMIEALSPYIGVSIRAGGTLVTGEAEGRKGRIVQEIRKTELGTSVDFVTKPGAGGKVLSIMESFRTPQAVPQYEPSPVVSSEAVNTTNATTNYYNVQYDTNTVPYTVTTTTTGFPQESQESEGADHMEELTEAQSKITELEGELAESQKATDEMRIRAERAEGALAILEAQATVKEFLDTVELPVAAKTRVVQKCAMNAPLKEGELDKDALKELVEAECKAEAEYIEAVMPQGRVTDQGSQPARDDKQITESLNKGLGDFFHLSKQA